MRVYDASSIACSSCNRARRRRARQANTATSSATQRRVAPPAAAASRRHTLWPRSPGPSRPPGSPIRPGARWRVGLASRRCNRTRRCRQSHAREPSATHLVHEKRAHVDKHKVAILETRTFPRVMKQVLRLQLAKRQRAVVKLHYWRARSKKDECVRVRVRLRVQVTWRVRATCGEACERLRI